MRTRCHLLVSRTLIAGAALTCALGCHGARGISEWPDTPHRTFTRGAATYRTFDFDADGRLDYMQRRRDGYVDRLYFPKHRGGALRHVVRRPLPEPARQPLVLLLLDGVAYERFRGLWEQGHFRLLFRPAKLVSVFPTLTDPAFDRFFGLTDTPGWEAGYYDAQRGRLTDGYRVYLSGVNERWVRYVDYRIPSLQDALMYLMPVVTFKEELTRTRAVVDACFAAGRQRAVVYMLSTDGVGHMLDPEELDRRLLRLDDWLERLVYDYRGAVELTVLADHGMSATPPERFDLIGVLETGGLRAVDRLEQPGDVAVPQFGLLDVARIHTYDEQTRARAVALLRERCEIELLAARSADGERHEVVIEAGGARARLRATSSAPRRYAYVPIEGDPLNLTDTMARLRSTGRMGADGFTERETWIAATHDHPFPAAVPRLWEAFFVISEEQPDIALSLARDWFVGSGFLSQFADLRGTHGGLHRRATLSFIASTAEAPPDPTTLSGAAEFIQRVYGWHPAEHVPLER